MITASTPSSDSDDAAGKLASPSDSSQMTMHDELPSSTRFRKTREPQVTLAEPTLTTTSQAEADAEVSRVSSSLPQTSTAPSPARSPESILSAPFKTPRLNRATASSSPSLAPDERSRRRRRRRSITQTSVTREGPRLIPTQKAFSVPALHSIPKQRDRKTVPAQSLAVEHSRLERKVQLLRDARKYQLATELDQPDGDGQLEKLCERWKHAGRSAAYMLWQKSTRRDMEFRDRLVDDASGATESCAAALVGRREWRAKVRGPARPDGTEEGSQLNPQSIRTSPEAGDINAELLGLDDHLKSSTTRAKKRAQDPTPCDLASSRKEQKIVHRPQTVELESDSEDELLKAVDLMMGHDSDLAAPPTAYTRSGDNKTKTSVQGIVSDPTGSKAAFSESDDELTVERCVEALGINAALFDLRARDVSP